jgi:hypothetical protein
MTVVGGWPLDPILQRPFEDIDDLFARMPVHGGRRVWADLELNNLDHLGRNLAPLNA